MDRWPAIHDLWSTILQFRNLAHDFGYYLSLLAARNVIIFRLTISYQRKVAPLLLLWLLLVVDSCRRLPFLDLWKISLLDELITHLYFISLLLATGFKRECLHTITFIVLYYCDWLFLCSGVNVTRL